MNPDTSLTTKQQEFQDFISSLTAQTMEELLGQLGRPTRDSGPFQFTLPNECGNIVFHYLRSIEFDHVGPQGYTFVVCERSSGKLDFSFRPPLPGGSSITDDKTDGGST